MTTSSIDRAELLKRRLSGQGSRRRDDGIPPAPRDGALPLSLGQRGLWILDRVRPGDVEYLMAILLRIRGGVDVAALRRALDAVVTRHEILRTRYVEADGEPVQVIDPPGAAALSETDLRGLEPAAARRRLDELVAEAGARPFDLAVEHPVRALLVHVTDGEHALLLTLHHIASDGWSESVLLSELDTLYAAHAHGEPAVLASLPCQYADFAAWQRDRLSGPRVGEQLDHWRAALAGLTPLDLRTDRPRGPVRDNAGASESFTVPAELVRTLTDLGRRHGATRFMVFLAAFQVLLGRHSGQRDVAVGTPSAGRDQTELHGLVGLFLTMLTLRADLSGDPTFLELLEQVRDGALDAYAHQDVPFELVVAELDTRHDPSRTPLFQATFQLGDGGGERLPGLDAVRVPVGAFAAKFELALTLTTRPDGSMAGDLTYATALFDAGTAADLVRHYGRLLAGVAADPGARIGRIALLTEAERAGLLFPHGPAEDVPVAAGESLVSAFRAQVARTPDAVAVSCGDRSLSYAELDERAERLARRLRRAGAAPGTLVGVRLERGEDLVPSLIGVLASGAGYLPLDPGLPADRLASMVADAGVRLVVSGPDLAPPGPGIVVMPPDGDAPDAAGPPPRAYDTAYVIYTSGSTGRPKGVAVSHANVLRLLRSCAGDYGFGPHDVWSMFHSYAFDVSVFELWGALLHGGRLVVVPHATSRSPRDFLVLLAAERVTVLSQTPSAFRALTEAMVEVAPDPADLPLRTVIFAGEALDTTDLGPWFARFGDRCPAMVNMYGITETTVHSTYRRIDATEAAGPRRSPIGRPLRDLRLYLLDDHLEPVPVGVPGQIYVGGPGVALGYLGRPELTADRFGPDPHAATPGERMYRSGDLAYRTRDGELEFLGRVDHQVKIRGFRVELGEIEAVLAGHRDVQRALVVAHRPAGERDARIVAYVTAAPGRTIDVGALREHLARVLPGYMVPAVFVPVDAFPVNANGKTDRSALPDPEAHLAAASTAHPVAPHTPLEAAIAAGWVAALGVPEVGVHDNFFALGGDSIRAIRVVGALRRGGIEASVQQVLVHQTIAELAQVLTRTGAAPATPDEDVRCAPFALLAEADRAALPPDLDDAYPMAMVQAAMVYQMVADPEESPYHNITVVPMADDAPFDLAAFRAAAALLAGRHDVLRTSFDLTSFSEPLQLVHRHAVIEVGHDDVRGLSGEERTARVAEFVAEVRRAPFDPARAPLLRLHVHRTAEDQWSLSFIECHAILDGWSHHSIIDELLADYRAIRAGGPPVPQPAPGVRFADFVAAERRSLRAGPDREFWRDRLARVERVRLPGNWAAAPGDDERPHEHRVPIADLEPGLRALALAAGVPLKSVLLAAHLKVLGTVSGSRRFHTGLVSNGRLETEGGDLVRGMHLNTLPIAADLTAATWTDLVRQVFAEEVATWPHRRFPLPEMQREWGGGTPLAEVAFTYLDFHILDHRLGDAHEAVDDSPNEFALDVWTFPGVVYLAGRPDRISRENGRRLAGLYRAVLESMAADPTGDARRAVLAPGERAEVLAHASGPAVGRPDVPIHELFEAQVARTPHAVALRCADGTTVDYAELNAGANRLARHLRTLGVRAESRVGVLLRRGPGLVTALLAVLKAGAAYLPLDPGHPALRTAALLAETEAAVVLTEPALSDKLAGADVRAVLPDHDPAIAGLSPDDLGRTAGPDSLAYIIYTSGSTGTPKGVLIEHRNLVNYVLWSLHAYTPRGGTGSPLYSSVAFDLPVTSLYPALLSGQAVTVTEDDGTPGVDALVAVLERGGFGLLKLTPSHLAVLNQSLTPQGVRAATGRLIAGGEELDREMFTSWARHAPGTIVDNEYGPTETTVGCSYLEGTAADLPAGVLPIGRPIDNTTMRVLDPDLELVPVGVTGELYLGGAQLARGYVARPDLTADRFVPDPYSTVPGARLYRSGDLARLRADGVLEFVGRVDGQVKIRGYRIEVGEVEAALRRVAAPRDVAVRAHTGADGVKILAAYLVPAADRPVDVDALPGRLAAILPQYLVPDVYVLLDAVPMTPSGKVDVAALPDPAPSTRPYAAPRNAMENMLARAWARVLGRRTVGIHDSFVELGGHSLVVMRVIVLLRERYEVRVSFRDFYLHRTVAELAAALADRPTTDSDGPGEPAELDGRDALVWLRREGSRPPLFCVYPGSVHWYAGLAEQLDDRPLAAFEWPGASRPWPAPESVEQIAELNLTQLRRVAPQGPYHLLGWCGGSQITTEMARRLHEDGEQVTFILLDPALDTYERDNMLDLMDTFRRAEALLAAIDDAPEEELLDLQIKARAELEVIVSEGEVELPVPGDSFWPSRARIWRELLQTRIDYRHRPYPGHVELLVGDELATGEHEVAHGQTFTDYAGRWAELSTGGLTIHRVSGNHLGVLRPPHVAGLAATLTRLLEATEHGPDGGRR